MKNDEVRMELTINIHYELGRTSIRELEQRLIKASEFLESSGQLEEGTEASVLGWESSVSVVEGSEEK